MQGRVLLRQEVPHPRQGGAPHRVLHMQDTRRQHQGRQLPEVETRGRLARHLLRGHQTVRDDLRVAHLAWLSHADRVQDVDTGMRRAARRKIGNLVPGHLRPPGGGDVVVLPVFGIQHQRTRPPGEERRNNDPDPFAGAGGATSRLCVSLSSARSRPPCRPSTTPCRPTRPPWRLPAPSPSARTRASSRRPTGPGAPGLRPPRSTGAAEQAREHGALMRLAPAPSSRISDDVHGCTTRQPPSAAATSGRRAVGRGRRRPARLLADRPRARRRDRRRSPWGASPGASALRAA